MSDSPNQTPSTQDEKEKYFLLQRYVGVAVAITLIGLMVLFATISTNDNTSVPNFSTAPENSANIHFKLSSDEENFDLKEFSGQAVIIAFWAQWCAPCLDDLPLLLNAFRGMPGIQIITLNIDTNPDLVKKARSFIDGFSPNSNQVHFFNEDFKYGPDLLELAQSLDAGTALPYHIALDHNHVMRWRGKGTVNWASPQVQENMMSLRKDSFQ